MSREAMKKRDNEYDTFTNLMDRHEAGSSELIPPVPCSSRGGGRHFVILRR